MAGLPTSSSPVSVVSLPEVTAMLHAEIPLTKAIGFSITGWDGKTVTLGAPLGPNQNHADTAFGGSISSLGILAGYGLLYVALLERKISTRILIQKSETEFLRPVDCDLVATATLPEAEALAEFLETLTRKRRARITLISQVLSGRTLAATHSGLYVAMLY